MINEAYLSKNSIAQIRTQLRKSKSDSVRLNEFLTKKEYLALTKNTAKMKFTKNKKPLKFSYSVAKAKSMPKQLNEFLNKITNKSFSTFSVKKFSHKDYTLIHDSLLPKKNQTRAILMISNLWNPKFGGNVVVLNKEETFLFPQIGNSLITLNQKKNQKSFIQYINHLAKNKSFLLLECTSK